MAPPRVLRLASVFEPPLETLAHAGFDPLGGMQVHTGALTRALDALGVEQTVVTARPPGARSVDLIGRRSRVVRLGVPLRRLRQLYSLPAAVFAPIAARNVELVHVHLGEDLAILPIAIAAARLNGLPLVLTVHCSLRHTLEALDARTTLLKSIGGAFESGAEARADEVLVLTERLASRLAADGVDPARVHVIPPAVHVAAYRRPTEDPLPGVPRPRVLFVGRLVPAKGPAAVLRAVASLPPGTQTVLVGDGPERRSLERLAASAGMDRRVHFTGFVPNEAMPAFLAHADVLAFPSMYEELGRTLVEATVAGLPIVASRTGGIPEIVEHGVNGFLVPPGDARALREALARILGDGEVRAGMRRAALSRGTRHDWTSQANEVLALYERAIARRSRSAARITPP